MKLRAALVGMEIPFERRLSFLVLKANESCHAKKDITTLKNFISKRVVALCTLVLCSSLVFGDGGIPGSPSEGCWTVTRDDGTEIGTLTISNNGNRGDFVNDAATNPTGNNTSLLYDEGDDGYNYPAGGSVSFTNPGPGRDVTQTWTSKDADGNVVDSGTISKCPPEPEPEPEE